MWALFSPRAYESYYKKALQIRRLVSDDFKNVFENLRVDVLLTPTAPTTAPALDELENIDPVTLYLNDVMTIPANMAGIPAMSVPVRLCKNGLPFGLQVLANRFEEDVMLDVAGILEGLWTQNRNQTPLNG
jgi:aspartyl-tRNA(Asn)/glutamyl-tRNA(Gln) amidotransferase subunit A